MKLKILVSCANGAGSSLMMKMMIERVVKSTGLDVQTIHHCALSEGKSAASQYDIVFCPLNFASMFADAQKKGTKIIGMKNILSDAEAKEKLKEAGVI